MSDRRFIRVEEIHVLYDTYEHLHGNQNPTEDDLISQSYRADTPISTIGCYWQGVISSTLGADLVNIRVMNMRRRNYRYFIPSHHINGRSVTVEDLVTLCLPNLNDDPDGFTLLLVFKYVRNNYAVLPDCICNV